MDVNVTDYFRENIWEPVRKEKTLFRKLDNLKNFEVLKVCVPNLPCFLFLDCVFCILILFIIGAVLLVNLYNCGRKSSFLIDVGKDEHLEMIKVH